MLFICHMFGLGLCLSMYEVNENYIFPVFLLDILIAKVSRFWGANMLGLG